MAVHQNTIWDTFLSPVVRFLIDEEKLQRYANSIDWEKESSYIRSSDVTMPAYYNQNFHGIKGGYLNSSAAVSYDPITEYALAPNETWVRQALIDAVKVQPRRILDLGCGTGSTTLMLKQTFPQAEVIGLDLSPYMLVRAADKAKTAGLNIIWRHQNAQETKFPDASFDLVTVSLLFHETPSTVTQAILQESLRLLVAGGQVLILDGNQKALRQLDWLNNIFEEPYIREYAADSLDARMGAAGFEGVRTEDIFWIHQVSSGIKPIPVTGSAVQAKVRQYTTGSIDDTIDNNDLEGLGSPAFGIKA
ncbi:class I SAM-dependent methyltransferase [Nostoc sp. FACHB-110]|uniref:class I SAM-dependent methyltransferase n=1 Tax=Nostoc sp. FACHB-110 TaxID=2692834 RepID=UPI00168831F4|nr:class I SAM-dependent methyltransferase [Nostoc sp. FACHB-110]MBD2435444.1 class I SAM-dependent methyltransferase [Nostoc sp. FACHB-110]